MKKIIVAFLIISLCQLSLFSFRNSFAENGLQDRSETDEKLNAKSLDEMIAEHRLIADEMLETSLNIADQGQEAMNVDDVYSQHNSYYLNDGSLDDLENKHHKEFEDLTRINQIKPLENDSGDF